jgi:signal transduction histidine kinase
VFDHASEDPVYCRHHTPQIYNIESYISVPIVLPNGRYFGNLCAIDPKPKKVSDSRTVTMFQLFADLIGYQIHSEERQLVSNTALLDERETGELREQFIAVLGHDLRNPLNTVGLAADILVSGSAEPGELQQLGNRLRASTRRMARLIDDVMDFARARLGSGIGAVIAATDDMAMALHDVVAELRETHATRVVRENIAIQGVLYCDRGRVQQLLSNLLGNALHHGAPDKPIAVEALHDGDILTIAVTNAGAPIAPENLKKVFDPYWRPSTSKQQGGLGLGLHICSQIVKAHGGTIDVGSSAEAGTRFVAMLPIGKPGA